MFPRVLRLTARVRLDLGPSKIWYSMSRNVKYFRCEVSNTKSFIFRDTLDDLDTLVGTRLRSQLKFLTRDAEFFVGFASGTSLRTLCASADYEAGPMRGRTM